MWKHEFNSENFLIFWARSSGSKCCKNDSHLFSMCGLGTLFLTSTIRYLLFANLIDKLKLGLEKVGDSY